MKQIFLGLLFSAVSLASWADGQYMQIWKTNGEVISVSLSETPVTYYSEGRLYTNTSSMSVSFDLSEIRKHTFYSDANGISAIGDKKVELSENGESITFHGLTPGSIISIYSSSGVLMKQTTAKDNVETVSVSGMPSGVYAVQANGGTFKITKK